ncbi:MAG: nitrate- and nitrite sensing domain-containing protein [Planctomycetota bacterium]
MTIKWKLLSILALPLFGLLALGARGFARSWHRAEVLADLQGDCDLNATLSSIVHESQKERGRTAAFLASGGERFAAELAEQRERTDRAIAIARQHVERLASRTDGDGFAAAVSSGMQHLRAIAELRSEVDRQSVARGEAVARYTAIHQDLLRAITAMAAESPTSTIVRRVLALASFLQARDRAGLERATLASAFAADGFADGLYERFVALVAEQQVYVDEYQALASDDARDLLARALQGPSSPGSRPGEPAPASARRRPSTAARPRCSRRRRAGSTACTRSKNGCWESCVPTPPTNTTRRCTRATCGRCSPSASRRRRWCSAPASCARSCAASR